MTHEEAVGSQASERYLLDEMSELERFQFEEHYFSCLECADSVKTGARLAEGIRASFAQSAKAADRKPEPIHRWRWFQFPIWIPSMAAAALHLVAGYQGLVVVPGLERSMATQSLTPSLVRSASRGEPDVVRLDPKAPFFLLAVETEVARPGERLSYTLQEIR